jgi:hypothetical protein
MKNGLSYNERNKIKAAERKRLQEEKRVALGKRPIAAKPEGWRKYFPLPVRTDDMYPIYLFDLKNQMMLMRSDELDDDKPMELLMHMVSAAVNNYECAPQSSGLRETAWRESSKALWLNRIKRVTAVDDTIIAQDGTVLIIARGWGYLTGTLALPGDAAAEIQDTMLREIAEMINRKYGVYNAN